MRRALSIRSCAGRLTPAQCPCQCRPATRRGDGRRQEPKPRRMSMKLYYSPGACSLASHIALLEGGLDFELERVDLKSKLTETGADFNTINTKGYVPALVLDSRDVLTENIAVLDWIATQAPHLGLDGPMGRTHLIQALAYISTEIHKSFKPFFVGASEEDKARAGQYINKRMRWLADRKVGKYLFGN